MKTFVEYVPESTPGLSKLPEQVYGAAADAAPAVMSIAPARATRLASHSAKLRFIDPSSPLCRSISSKTVNATTPRREVSHAEAKGDRVERDATDLGEHRRSITPLSVSERRSRAERIAA
jgi:hypothetical protein